MKKIKLKSKFTPIEGYGGLKIIGYWDEYNSKFISKNNKTIEQTFLKDIQIRPKKLPFSIVISKKKINGRYYVFNGLGSTENRNEKDNKRILIRKLIKEK